MKTAIKILWTAVIALIVGVAGVTAWYYAEYKLHPENHAIESAPWYTLPMIIGAAAALIIIICIIVIAVLKHKSK